MIDSTLIDALRIIYDRLTHQNIRWVLVGSVSLALNGVNIEPEDIDILTDKEGAYRINELIKEYEVRPVKFGQTETVKSHLGEFLIRGIKVEVMGDMWEKVRGEWQDMTRQRLTAPRIIRFPGMDLPISQLADQLASYEASGREKDVAKVQRIREALGS